MSFMNLKVIRILLVSVFFAFSLSSCLKQSNLPEVVQPTEAQEMALLTKYIAKFHPGLVPKSSGLYIIETKAAPAGADSIKVGDKVSVFYSGYLISDDVSTGVKDGYNFDNSGSTTPYSFLVGTGAVIPGWDEGVTYLKSGSEAKLIIPSKLAYYSSYNFYMPAYSTLIFYIKISKSMK